MTAYEHGYKTAAGEIGTGWMQFRPNDLEDKDPQEYAYDWLETLQFEYETEGLFKDVDPETYVSLCEDWTTGYADYISSL